jgi:hypothetical protein
MLTAAQPTHIWRYNMLQFGVALGIAVLAGGVAFFLIGTIITLVMRGTEAVDGTPEAITGAILFSIVLVGLFGGVPGALLGMMLVRLHKHSLAAFIGAGIAASLIAPVAIMVLTPIGIDGWSMLIVAVPAGAAGAAAAWYYLKRYTTVLASRP